MGGRVASIYLRVSVIDRCDLRCVYCMGPEGIELKSRDDIASFEEIVSIAKLIDSVRPIRKLRLTGGEPLVRRDVAKLVRMLREALPSAELTMTTNGYRLAELAGDLAAAGLDRVNVSLDTLDAERYRSLTRGGDISRVFAGIEAAVACGLVPVKLNAVLLRGVNDDELADLIRFAGEGGFRIRFVELMPTPVSEPLLPRMFLSVSDALELIGRAFDVQVIDRNASGYMVCRAGIDGAGVEFELIPSMTGPFCETCDRLRLDSTARLYPCLLSDEHLDLRAFDDDDELMREVERIIRTKRPPDVRRRSTTMNKIGG